MDRAPEQRPDQRQAANFEIWRCLGTGMALGADTGGIGRAFSDERRR